MRKIIVLSMISLDGVLQAPGGRKEDPSGGFKYGGWSAPYNDEVSGKEMQRQMAPTDILVGRKTFDIFASFWPQHAEHWPGINEVTKYVLSNTIKSSTWEISVFLTSVEDIKKLKNSEGSDIKVWGSSELIHLLLEHGLVDELHLRIFPIILGKGKKLFDNSSVPSAFVLTESVVTTKGVFIAHYKRTGEVTQTETHQNLIDKYLKG